MGVGGWIMRVRERLEAAGVPFSQDVAIDGYRADFVFQTPDGHRHLIETKSWEPTPQNLSRAKKLAVQLKTLPVDGSFVVLPVVGVERPEDGVVSVKGLDALLKRAGTATGGSTGTVVQRAPLGPARTVFAAMPFSPTYDDVFFVAIRGAAKSTGTVAKRVDKEDYAGDVVERIRQRVSLASAVVVDLSESRPNVLYEMGFAHAAGKPVVPICSTAVDEVPFDVRNLNILQYEPGQTNALRPKLARRLRAVLASAA